MDLSVRGQEAWSVRPCTPASMKLLGVKPAHETSRSGIHGRTLQASCPRTLNVGSTIHHEIAVNQASIKQNHHKQCVQATTPQLRWSTIMRTIRSRTAAACLIVAAIQIHGVASLRKHDVHRHSRTDVFRRKQQHSISATINNVRGGGRHNAIDVTSTPTPSTNASKGTLQAMRLLYLTYYASMGALMPYLPVYFHSLGHKGTSIGLLGAVKPLTTLLAAPLWGIISDKSGNHVSTLQFTFVTSLVCQLLVAMDSNLTYLIVTVFITALLSAPVKSLIDSIVMR